MDKPAQIVLHFNKQSDSFWLAMLNVTDKKSVQEFGDEVYALLPVKSYSLDDHQFVQIKFNVNSGKELLVWIPRGNVKTVIEGKTDLGHAFTFAGKTTK